MENAFFRDAFPLSLQLNRHHLENLQYNYPKTWKHRLPTVLSSWGYYITSPKRFHRYELNFIPALLPEETELISVPLVGAKLSLPLAVVALVGHYPAN